MHPANRRFSTGGGCSLWERILSGLSDFGNRSLNLSVLVTDTSLHNAYKAAESYGELPTNRARVLILGEPRAGKTSLLNRLLGRSFNCREQPTHGIETRMCHVINVDKQWNESGDARADNIRECASAVVVREEVSPDGLKRRGHDKSTSKKPTKFQTDLSQPESSDLMKILRLLQLVVIIAVVFVLGIFQYGYSVFVWCSVLAMTMVLDYNNAYRFATSMSLVCALFEAMVRIDQPLKELACEVESERSHNRTIHFTRVMLFNLMNTVLTGFANGIGLRTGMAVAFSACVHPTETNFTLEAVRRGIAASWNIVVLCVIFVTGGFLSIATYKYCTANDRLHKKKIAACCGLLVPLIFAVSLKADCKYHPFLFIFFNGFLTTIGGAWGVIFGRRAVLKYGFEARYVTKKTAGFIYGLYLAHVCGWTLNIPKANLTSWAFYVLSIIAHPVFDLHTTYKIWRLKPVFPTKIFRDQMKAAIKGRPILETKLSLWDFAGDSLYHCAHHVFMPDRALYIIVFNLQAAVSDEDGQINKLLFWLYSVCAHARHPDAVIMIIGTHNASVSEASRLSFADKLHAQITPLFCHRLVLNPSTDSPLFPVENSQPHDRQFKQLRAEIFRRVESAEYAQEKYPIKYLQFYREIQHQRKLAEVDRAASVLTLRQVHDLARKTCNIQTEDNLRNMLRFFCEAGEVIYKDDDEVLRQHVVLDPQFLVDVMKKLVQIPRACQRSHRYAVGWMNYENSGIITEGLLEHIYDDMPHLVPLLTHLLQAYDLMCPIGSIADPSHSSFLVPAVLSPFRGDSAKFWTSKSDEEVFYFDFGFFEPSTIYYRLLTRCLTHACVDKANPKPQRLIFADRCRLYIGTSFIFKLELERRSSHQMLLSVTVLAFDPRFPSSRLLTFLFEVVRSITTRDYPHLRFTFGPRCPFCFSDSEADSDKNGHPIDAEEQRAKVHDHGEAIHVLKMAGHDQPFPSKSPVVMLCGLQRYQLKLSGNKSKDRSTPHPERLAFNMETPLTKLPTTLFRKVCSLLNIAGSRDWKTLADELGKDVEYVTHLGNARVQDPTEHLLQDWAMTDGGVTVGDLLEVLGRPSLQRMDIIADVRAQMAQD